MNEKPKMKSFSGIKNLILALMPDRFGVDQEIEYMLDLVYSIPMNC